MRTRSLGGEMYAMFATSVIGQGLNNASRSSFCLDLCNSLYIDLSACPFLPSDLQLLE